jgi:hypothetical protein
MAYSLTVSLGWPQTSILLISLFQVARITGMCQQRLGETEGFMERKH